MLDAPRRIASISTAATIFLLSAACAGQTPPLTYPTTAPPSSIQPETTLNVSATGTVEAEPDIAWITAGVQTQAPSAQAAMAANAKAMNGVFKALERAGVAPKDMQTSNFALSPIYDHETVRVDGTTHGRRVLKGYEASNQLAVRVRDLRRLGKTLDELVSAGGNTFSGLRFALEDDTEVQDQAREKAMKAALAKAKVYASAAGYKVARIVTITEDRGGYPRPMMMQARAASAGADATPIASGELTFEARVDVVFQLTR
ncbi:MAG: SIMPL domain-containing protein [Myxococcales bacterium]|nr:SIMPL domain-containing protein [Myxococcales bacterium]